MSLRDKILAARDLKAELMEIPEWGVSVEVRGMSADARAEFMQSSFENGLTGEDVDQTKMVLSMISIFPKFVRDGVYDPETGLRVFEEGDLDALKAKNGEVLQRIAFKVIELSGLDEKAVDKAGKPS